jgi:myo-inositol 2-dehydrogenase/D-chiro-inositol 1-dehydrogenase
MDTAGSLPEDPPDGRFRLGLIGAGRMGRTHLDALADSPVITVAGVAEPGPAQRAAVRDAGIPAFASAAELLAAGGLDGALIAAPTDRHVGLVTDVLAAGLPVLCEKPCGLTVEEAAQCAAAAGAAGLVLQVAYWRRFVPELVRLRQQILGGELGDILAVNCYQWDAAPPGAEFRGSSGGIFVDMGVHEFDQVRWLTGQEFSVLKVAVAGGSAADPDCGQLVAELDGGSTALVSLGRWHPAGDTCAVQVFGTKGTVWSPFLQPPDGDAVFRDALRRQAEDFAACARSGHGQGATIGDAVAALTLARQALTGAQDAAAMTVPGPRPGVTGARTPA